MKRFVLVLLFLCFSTTCFAAVTAKVLEVKCGERDYIWIKIEYDIDGVKTISSYPMDFKNIVGKTNAEILAWIKANVEYQVDRYIEAEFRKKINLATITDKLSTLVGKTYTRDSATLQFDTNNDNVPDKQWVIKTDGTYVETTLP